MFKIRNVVLVNFLMMSCGPLPKDDLDKLQTITCNKLEACKISLVKQDDICLACVKTVESKESFLIDWKGYDNVVSMIEKYDCTQAVDMIYEYSLSDYCPDLQLTLFQ